VVDVDHDRKIEAVGGQFGIVDPLLHQAAAGARVTTPTGMVLDGTRDLVKTGTATTALDDPDSDGVRRVALGNEERLPDKFKTPA